TPEVILAGPGGGVLGAPPQHPLEGVAVCVDQAGEQQLAREALEGVVGTQRLQGFEAPVGGHPEQEVTRQAALPPGELSLKDSHAPSSPLSGGPRPALAVGSRNGDVTAP